MRGSRLGMMLLLVFMWAQNIPKVPGKRLFGLLVQKRKQVPEEQVDYESNMYHCRDGGQTNMSATSRVRENILSLCLAFVNPNLVTVSGSPEEDSGRLKQA